MTIEEEGRPALVVIDAGRLDRACEELGIGEGDLARLIRRYLGRGRVLTLEDLARLVGEMRDFARMAGLGEEVHRG